MLWPLAVALALTVAWCCSGATAAATPGPCSITSAETFYQALSNPQCNPLRIESSGLSLTQTSWAAAAAGSFPSPAFGSICPVPSLVVSRNLTLEGAGSSSSSSSSNSIMLDCGFLKSRIAITDGATFTLRGLRLANCRQPSALLVVGLDLLTVGAGSQLVLEDVQYECAICPPLAQAVSLALSVPRPVGSAAGVAPGAEAAVGTEQDNQEQQQQQAVRLVRNDACPSLSAVGPEQAQAPGTCISEALLYDDFAQYASGVCFGGVRLPSGGLVRSRNVTQHCSNVVSPSCVADKGLGLCTREALESLQLSTWDTFDLTQQQQEQQQQQQQQKSAGLSAVVAAAAEEEQESLEEQEAVVVVTKGDANTRRLLAIVIPTVCGALALLFVLAGMVVWRRLRKKFAPCPDGIKEAYEGVVFVGLSQGSETAVPTRNLDLEELHLNLGGSAGAVTKAGVAKGKKRAALGPEELDGVWGGNHHRHLASWDGALDGRARGSTSVSNCTSTSAPAVVGIIVAGITSTEAVATPTATSTITTSPALPMAFEVASLQPHPHIHDSISYHYHHHHQDHDHDHNHHHRHHHHKQQQHRYEQRQIQMQQHQQQTQTPKQKEQQQQGSDEQRQQEQHEAQDLHLHRHGAVTRKTSTADGGGGAGGGGGGGGGGRRGGGAGRGGGGGDVYDGPCVAPVNLILGADVIVTSQPVLSRSPLGSAVLGQYGQIPVAVKVFHRDEMGGSFEELRALREDIDALARTCCPGSHPHVVSVLGTGETPGGDEVFVLEELMASHLLRAIYEGGGLSIERALSIALDVALGLSYLHPNIVHGTLKPESVLLDSSFNAKLADYGLGRLQASFGQEARELRTMRARYLAPEGFRSGKRRLSSSGEPSATPQADMYSFGVLLWEMLSREVPWRGMDAAQIAMAVSGQQRRLDLPANDRFPPKIRKLIQQCWEQEPTMRPTASDVARRLSRMLPQERGIR